MKRSKRSLAAIRGWKTRRHNERSERAKAAWRVRKRAERAEQAKRSAAAKKGWRTRRKNAAKRHRKAPPTPVLNIVRLTYKPKDGKIQHFEAVYEDEKLIKVSVGSKHYTEPGDLAAFSAVLEAAEPE